MSEWISPGVLSANLCGKSRQCRFRRGLLAIALQAALAAAILQAVPSTSPINESDCQNHGEEHIGMEKHCTSGHNLSQSLDFCQHG